MNPITVAIIGAGQRGLDAYASYALRHPEEMKVVAVAEPIAERREETARLHGIDSSKVFSAWKELLAKDRMADAAIVCTQDKEHFHPTRIAMEKGYHVLVEKPMSPDPLECLEMGRLSGKHGRILSVCHVLRYSPFFSKIKEIVDSGVIGEIACIQHIENVGYWHQAHSFVRGNWRNSDETSPMILAKSCHDMDIINWMAGRKCEAVSSFGSLSYFKPENAPKGAAKRCLGGCADIGSCPYSAKKIYLDSVGTFGNMVRRIICGQTGLEAARKAVEEGPYGRCVYFCDNNVVDRQIVNLQFENGLAASFTMSGFTARGGRDVNIMGTKGQLLASMEERRIDVLDFLTEGSTRHEMPDSALESGHFGSDDAMMAAFVRQLRGLEEGKTSAEVSVESHLIALAAEKSRVSGKTVRMDEFKREVSNEE
jgi:predicted dehydrogenase